MVDKQKKGSLNINTEEDPPTCTREDLEAIAHQRAKEERLREFLKKAEDERADRAKRGVRSLLDINLEEDPMPLSEEELKAMMSPEAWQRHLESIEQGKAFIEKLRKGGRDH